MADVDNKPMISVPRDKNWVDHTKGVPRETNKPKEVSDKPEAEKEAVPNMRRTIPAA